MASVKVLERINLGNRLFRVGGRFYIRVAIPRDLKNTFTSDERPQSRGRRRSEGKSPSELFEPLKGPDGERVVDRREAERLCRQRGAEIDADFALRRKRLKRDETELPGAVLDGIAGKVFRDELQRHEDAMKARPGFDPEQVIDGLGHELDTWSFGLRENVWLPEVEKAVDALLKREGFTLPHNSPAFIEARQKIARAMAAANRTAAARARGDYGFVFDDPVVKAPPAPLPTTGITLGTLIENYENDHKGAWTDKTADG
jgi:hypothetical protein